MEFLDADLHRLLDGHIVNGKFDKFASFCLVLICVSLGLYLTKNWYKCIKISSNKIKGV